MTVASSVRTHASPHWPFWLIVGHAGLLGVMWMALATAVEVQRALLAALIVYLLLLAAALGERARRINRADDAGPGAESPNRRGAVLLNLGVLMMFVAVTRGDEAGDDMARHVFVAAAAVLVSLGMCRRLIPSEPPDVSRIEEVFE